MLFSRTTLIMGGLFLMAAHASYASSPSRNSGERKATEIKVTVDGLDAKGFIEPRYAYCVAAAQGHTEPGENHNVGLRWTAGPQGTKSYAVIMVDEDVPTDFTMANKEGETIPYAMPRRPFYHWVLVNIPTHIMTIPASTDSASIAAKPSAVSTYGFRGRNDYTSGMDIRAGYDGPCPPWNDERVHHYHFRVYALRTEAIDTTGILNGQRALSLIAPHVLAVGEAVGKYTQNPALLEKKQ